MKRGLACAVALIAAPAFAGSGDPTNKKLMDYMVVQVHP